MSAPAAAGFLQSPLPHCFAATPPPLAGSPHRWVTGLPQWRWLGKSPESAVAATRAVPGGTKAPLSAQAEPGDCQITLLKPARRECKGSHGAGVSASPASVSLLLQAGRGLTSLPRCCNPCSPWSTPAVSSPAVVQRVPAFPGQPSGHRSAVKKLFLRLYSIAGISLAEGA